MKYFLSLILTIFYCGYESVYAQNANGEEPDDSGLYIGMSLMGTSFEIPEFSDEGDTGGGLHLELGYNFNTNFALFLGLDGSSMDPDVGDSYTLAHFDIGAEGRLGDFDSKFRPFLRASLTGMSAQYETPEFDGDVDVSGAGLGIGVGLHYFPASKFALKLGYTHSWIEVSEVTFGSISIEVSERLKPVV